MRTLLIFFIFILTAFSSVINFTYASYATSNVPCNDTVRNFARQETAITSPLNISSPLKQFKFGINAMDVQCKEGSHLVIKSENNFPSCVQTQSLERLTKQGWVVHNETEIQSKFQSSLIDKNHAVQIAQDYLQKSNMIHHLNYSNSDIASNLVYYITFSFPRVPVNYNTGMPTQVMDWLDEYYKNPQWWSELEKSYLRLPSHRIEPGHVVWELVYGRCGNCIANQPMIFVDAVTGKIIDTKWLY